MEATVKNKSRRGRIYAVLRKKKKSTIIIRLISSAVDLEEDYQSWSWTPKVCLQQRLGYIAFPVLLKLTLV